MRSKLFIFIATLVILLAVGSVAVYAYDSSRSDVVADGVTVGGVEVGGLTADEARQRLERQLASRIEQPIAVERGGVRFTLSAEDAGVDADVEAMVDEAIEASRDGNVLSRVMRDLTGDVVDTDVPARATYSQAAARKLAARVKETLDRAPQDATLDFPSLEAVKERNGLSVRPAELRLRIAAALTSPTERTVTAPVKVTKPEVTRAELAEEYPVLLVADRSSFQLKLYKDLELVKTYTVAVGAIGFDTPAGLYHIQNKAVDPAWSVPDSDWAGDLAGTVVPGGVPENPLKARWLGIYDGAGIHGTDNTASLGSAASHGCIRMAIPDVVELYDQVPVQTPIYIA